ncbi:hypothetical protein O7623_16055 [Solwaraspora sp. WMMD791]|uniref:hypothetical protein n=1 Tax=Solwaraspora sp. WMMD791 TaxID=3016086 RepID=UPI00249C2391|nr:hypothetical protein [Solwaraspora sp. WMMD791]WFE24945.1 hypothetical protein O7623_16055 [Solwaraspora sp. WMMD791]
MRLTVVGIYFRLQITDTLGVWVEGTHAFDPAAGITRTFWYRLPTEWVVNGAILQQRREMLVDRLYGPGWRNGNPDGSRYIILRVREKVLTDGEAAGKPWLAERGGFFVCAPDGAQREVVPSEL